MLFCQTEPMRRRVAGYYSYDIDKIRLLPNAISFALRSAGRDGTGAIPPAIRRDKFNCLLLSRYYVHKNPEIITEAVKRNPHLAEKFNFIVTITESESAVARRFLRKIQSDSLLSRCFSNAGVIPQSQLAGYYRSVQLVIMPSLMESFSVTYLETLYYEVPILTTDFDFAHYLCGQAACYYDPFDPDDLAEKLCDCYGNPGLLSQLVEEGVRQYGRFDTTWEQIAKNALTEVEKAYAAHIRQK